MGKGRKNVLYFIVIAIAAVVLLVTRNSLSGPSGTATPVTVGGAEITVGKTTVGELAEKGFQFRVYESKQIIEIDPAAQKVEKQTWVPSITAKKGEENACTLTIVNAEKKEQTLADCVIYEVKSHDLDSTEYKHSEVVIDGVSLNGMTPEEVKKNFPDAKVLKGDADTSFESSDGDYSVSITANKEMVTEVKVVCEFSKKY